MVPHEGFAAYDDDGKLAIKCGECGKLQKEEEGCRGMVPLRCLCDKVFTNARLPGKGLPELVATHVQVSLKVCARGRQPKY